MKTQFIHFLQQQGASADDVDVLTSQAQAMTLPAKTLLAPQGQCLQHFYWLFSGIGHACYITAGGKSFSKEFYWEGDWVIGFEPLVSEQPLPYQQETLSECQLMALPISLLKHWRMRRHPWYTRLLESQLLHKENKERLLLLNNPEQRYVYFCQHYPFLRNRLTDYQIAGYLGITPISLSRIIARLKQRGETN
jgi:CRP-like cAMP-binding protein